MRLEDLGWDAHFAEAFARCPNKDWVPARLIRDNKISYGALLGDGREYEVTCSGRVYHAAATDADLPAVGDWVALDSDECVIRERLPRRNTLSRKMPGRSTQEQVLAANVDVVAVITNAGPDFNLRRMERYFAIIARSGARVVVLMNKADLFTNQKNQAALEAVQALHPEADIHLTSIATPRSLTVLKQYLSPGNTVAFIGSSGVGKSSIINHLLGGDFQWTDEVNEITGKGRHATTARELMVLRRGGVIIDNPGIREVHMWTDESMMRERFADLEELGRSCQFDDCTHGPRVPARACAIRKALESGTLDAARFAAYLKLEDEISKLQVSRKKREATVARRTRRDDRARSTKYADRHESAQE